VALAAALAASGVVEGTSPAAVPVALAASSLRAVALVVAGQGAAGTAYASAAALAGGVLRALALAKLKGATAMVLTAVILAVSAFGLAHPSPAPHPAAQVLAAPQEKSQPRLRPARAPAEDPEMMTVAGRVLGPDDQPVAGAQVAVVGDPRRLLHGGGDEGKWQVLGRARAEAL
jgi:hypothetical protein